MSLEWLPQSLRVTKGWWVLPAILLLLFLAAQLSRNPINKVSAETHLLSATHPSSFNEPNNEIDGYWLLEAPIPVARNHAAVVSYGGSLYVMGGNGSNGTSYQYNPETRIWSQLATMSPTIDSPEDGCLGYNEDGDPVIVLLREYEDEFRVPIPGWMMVYNIKSDTWVEKTIPSPIPNAGISNPDIATDLDNNVCYISGGKLLEFGGGDQTKMYAYHPDTHTARQLPDFTTSRQAHVYVRHVYAGHNYTIILGGNNEKNCGDYQGPLEDQTRDPGGGRPVSAEKRHHKKQADCD